MTASNTSEGATDLLMSAFETVRALPSETQDQIARAMLDWAQNPEDFRLDAGMLESLAQADRGEFASEEDVRSMWTKFGL